MHIKDHLIQTLLEDNKLLQSKVEKLEIDVQQNFQKQRENNIEVSGIPAEVSDDQLEGTVISILSSIECTVLPCDIQACHRLPSRNNTVKKTIVKFVNRKEADLVLKNRRKFKDVEKSYNAHFTGNEQIFINENLTPYYATLALKCRSLKRKGVIRDLKSFRGQIRITTGLSNIFIMIRSETDLKANLTEVQLASLDES